MRCTTVPSLSTTTCISFAWLNCPINSRQAPQGGNTFPFLFTAITMSISNSPAVIIVHKAFRSAHIPSEQSVSTHTPVKIRPCFVHTAAPTPPEHICSLITWGTATAFAASYSFWICASCIVRWLYFFLIISNTYQYGFYPSSCPSTLENTL